MIAESRQLLTHEPVNSVALLIGQLLRAGIRLLKYEVSALPERGRDDPGVSDRRDRDDFKRMNRRICWSRQCRAIAGAVSLSSEEL